jgi:hypothetical protein
VLNQLRTVSISIRAFQLTAVVLSLFTAFLASRAIRILANGEALDWLIWCVLIEGVLISLATFSLSCKVARHELQAKERQLDKAIMNAVREAWELTIWAYLNIRDFVLMIRFRLAAILLPREQRQLVAK